MKTCICSLAFVAFLVVVTLTSSLKAQPLVTIQTAAVGDAGNAADGTGYGAVTNVFALGKYEVTIGQYTSFLNAVAATDTYSLYNPSMAADLNIAGITQAGSSGNFSYSAVGSSNRPISHVNWFDAARFANWMNNGATVGASTETGAYTLNGATAGIITKSAGATWWIPSEDEWYKAAYYKGGGTNAGYWDYPTQSDTAPGNVVGGAPNQANSRNEVYSVTQSASYSSELNYLTDVGAFSSSASAYNTYDQGGNVMEWSDAVAATNASRRLASGGSWAANEFVLASANSREDFDPSSDEYGFIGFRLATVPEPSTYALLLMAGAGWLLWRRRKLTI